MDCTAWIETVTGAERGDQTFHTWLRDGCVLCALANEIRPGIIRKVRLRACLSADLRSASSDRLQCTEIHTPEVWTLSCHLEKCIAKPFTLPNRHCTSVS